MKDYHRAWLAAHPKRSEEWLQARLSDNFHIHHIDGDKTNNGPANLLLIEGDDHMQLHGIDLAAWARRAASGPRKPRKPGLFEQEMIKARRALAARIAKAAARAELKPQRVFAAE